MHDLISAAFLDLDKKQTRIKAVFISTANNVQNTDFLIASTKENSEIACVHFIVRTKQHLQQISDLAIQYKASVFLDCEKKGAYDLLVDDYSSISSSFHQLKPNEFSARTVDTIIETQKITLSPTCLILGVGDLGLKVSQFLANRNCRLVLSSRNLKKANACVEYLTASSQSAKVESISYEQLLKYPSQSFDFIVASAAGNPVVRPEHISLLKGDGKIVDAGTGCIAPETIALANQSGIKIYSLYSGDMLLSEINSLLMTERRYNFLQRKMLVDGSVLVSAGLVGGYGDVIVDNVEKPTNYIAVCDGKGGTLPHEIATNIMNKVRNLSRE